MALYRSPDKGDPNKRLIMLVVLLIGVLLAMHNCHKASTVPAYPPPAGQVMITADETVSAQDPLPGIMGTDSLETKYIDDLLKYDDSNRREAANLLLLKPAFKTIFSWLKNLGDEKAAASAISRRDYSHNRIMREPSRWRYNILHVYGVLAQKQILSFGEDMPHGLNKLFRLTLFDERKHLFSTVLTPLMPKNATEGSHIACDGVFAMRFPYESDTGWKYTPLFFARRAYLSSERPGYPEVYDERKTPGIKYADIVPEPGVNELNLQMLERKVFAPSKDGKGLRLFGTDFREMASDLRSEKDALVHVLRYMHSLNGEKAKELVNPEIGYVPLMEGNAPPSWMRGQIVKMRGHVMDVAPLRFPDSPHGVKHIYLVTAYDISLGMEYTWTLAVCNLPKGFRENDRFETEGVFFKLYPYKTLGKKWHWSPLLVCKELRLETRPEDNDYTLQYVLTAVGMVILVILWRMSAKRDNDVVMEMRKRSQERRASMPLRKKSNKPATGKDTDENSQTNTDNEENTEAAKDEAKDE